MVKEVHARMGKAAGAQATALSPQAVEAIKAALDADMTREVQKLNGQMVLLTIAISGGPFLGLLGTVVGVMITFAAIAATGDVNIAAIAPGVAAALLTTVAGLFVAIPALFGYNWLMSRIKESVVDMRVFADEFLTRIAEYYGE
ncbi:MAG: MotA/TolQ/ExbB proton channel family protein [Pseudomonadales bacterium]|nr:MotA/TolQ/ExbB proton channel family protein [Pseudomonadales bacterium]